MTSVDRQSNPYNDSPPLHPNLIVGSFQLLAWLFFHPSAWANHVARIDPELRPDFRLAELTRDQYRNSHLQRLLIMGYVVLPFLVGSIVGVLTWAINRSEVLNHIEHVTMVIFLYMVSSVAVGTVVGVAPSVAAGVAGSMIDILPSTIWATGVFDWAITGFELYSKVGFMPRFELRFIPGVPGALHQLDMARGVAIGVACSVAVRVASQGQNYTLSRQLLGVFVGVVIGTIVSIITLIIGGLIISGAVFGGGHAERMMPLFFASFYVSYVVQFAVLLSMAAWLCTNKWRLGLTVGLIMGFLAFIVNAYGFTNIDLYSAVVFASTYGFGRWIAGPWAGALAGSLAAVPTLTDMRESVALLPAVSWTSRVGLEVWPILIVAWALPLWRPILFYPFEVAWNLILYRADERRSCRPTSLLTSR